MDDAIFGGTCEVIHQGERKYCVVIRKPESERGRERGGKRGGGREGRQGKRILAGGGRA